MNFRRTALRSSLALVAGIGMGIVSMQTPGALPTGRAAAASTLYPAVVGGIDRHKDPDSTERAAGVTSWVVEINWSTLQPSSSADSITSGTRLNALRQAVAAAGNSKGVIKLRVLAGINAPAWAKQLGGGALTITDVTTGGGGARDTVGRFWTPQYESAYAALLAQVSSTISTMPQVGDVVLCESSVVFCDGTKQMGGGNESAFAAARYSEAADITEQEAAMAAAARLFPHTHVAQAFFPFQYLDANQKVQTSMTDTIAIMKMGQKDLGARFIEENYSASDNRESGSLYAPLFTQMRSDAAHGVLTEYQTATLAKEGNLCATLEWIATTQHGISVELPSGYDSAPGCPLRGKGSSVATWIARIAANG